MTQIHVAIFGYGNLGRGVEYALRQNPDMIPVGVFTRRDPETVTTVTGLPVFAADRIEDFKDGIDVLIICGGSATDLPRMTPRLASLFNVVDSFDTHATVPEHFAQTDAAARSGGHTAVISGGWDPGLFSLARLYASSVLPAGKSYTFWGRGVSQGHSDAIRRIPGVIDARQYTVPVPEAVEAVRTGSCPELTAGQKHKRECYVCVEDNADKSAIEQAIKTMPHYFDEYDTTVTFVTREELAKNHSGLPHGGFVLHTGKTGEDRTETFEFKLTLDSNPEFTGSVLVALARAAFRQNARGMTGCKTVFDLPPCDLSPLSAEQLRATLL